MKNNAADVGDVSTSARESTSGVVSDVSGFAEFKDVPPTLDAVNRAVNSGKIAKIWSPKLNKWLWIVHSDLVRKSPGEPSRYSILEYKLLIDHKITAPGDLQVIDSVKNLFSCRITEIKSKGTK